MKADSRASKSFNFERTLQGIERFPQVVNLDINYLGSWIKVISPDVIQNGFAANELPLIMKQNRQESA